MIVFGDHEIATTTAVFAERLLRRYERAGPHAGLEERRTRLVLAGALEQGVADAGLACSEACRALTRAAAEDFVDALVEVDLPFRYQPTLTILRELKREPGEVHIRSPEGFACYGLYPDAYAAAALAWARSADRAAPVVVVGIRSIGTTLAAVVSAVLRAQGFNVEDITVRPEGAPYARTTRLPSKVDARRIGLIVDEGPGLSGSSMASVAEALVARGATRVEIFPGHSNGPGERANPALRRWWKRVPSHVAAFDIAPFARSLASRALREPVASLQDVGGGRWTRVLSLSQNGLHALAPRFEQPKYIARTAVATSTLLKFAGISAAPEMTEPHLVTRAEASFARLQRLAAKGWTTAPRATAHGFVALPWIEGRRLSRSTLSPALLAHLVRYVGQAARPPLTPKAHAAAIARLALLLMVNTEELLGPPYESMADVAADNLRSIDPSGSLPAAGDGRLAPHEWVQTYAGRLVKMDAAGHEADHTAPGAQSILWDYAGLIVEWDLDEAQSDQLLRLVAWARVDRRALAGYAAAYAAFRAALATMGREEDEAGNRRAAIAFYSNRLARELDLVAAQSREGSAWRSPSS